MLWSSEPPATKLARLVAAVLARDTGSASEFHLSEFFEGRIAPTEDSELQIQIPQHALYTKPVAWEPMWQASGRVALKVTIGVRAYMPRMAPAVGYVAVPTFSAGTPGSAYQYRLTQFTDRSESYASAPVGTAALGVLTLPSLATGIKGYRIWRSEENGSACHWIATVFTPGTWTDSGLSGRDELAPIRGIGDVILGQVDSILRNDDAPYLLDGSRYSADGLLSTKPKEPALSRGRNVMLHALDAVYQTIYLPGSGQILVGGLQ